MITLAGCVSAHTAGCRPVVPSSWEEGSGVVEKKTVITYFIGLALFVPLPPRTPPSRRRGPRWVSTTLARDSPPSEATGVFRAAIDMAAAPQRGANPSFATEELGEVVCPNKKRNPPFNAQPNVQKFNEMRYG